MTFTVPSVFTPTSGQSATSVGDCCWMSEWVGIGDRSGASDGTLVQAGVDKGTNSWAFRNNQMFIEILSPSLTPSDQELEIQSPCPGGIADGDVIGVRVLAETVPLGESGTQPSDNFTIYDMNSQGSIKCVFALDTVKSQLLMAPLLSPTWAYYIVEAPRAPPEPGSPVCSLSSGITYVCELPAWEPATQEAGYLVTDCCGIQPISFAGVSSREDVLNQCIDYVTVLSTFSLLGL